MFGGTWGNSQPNPQQTGSAFGQPSGFGGSAFGTGGAFGQNNQQQQPQQPQQPQANPMFGNFAGTNTNPSTGFGSGGAFGSTPANTSNNNSLFGTQPKPATGFGAFGGGGTSSFGSTNAFGQNANTTSAFGQPSTSTSAFGSGGGGLFGGKPATGFGSTQSNPNVGPYDGVAPVTTGTGGTSYSAFNEKDSTNQSVTLQYQSITCMPTYRGNSFEELRLQDYQQGRKTASTSTGFGTSGFGSTSQPAGGNLFGPNQATQSAWGNPTSPTTNAGFSAFSQPSNQTTTPSTFGAFGQPQQPQSTSAFGSGGAFGAPQQQQPQPSSGAVFGSTSTFGKPSVFGTAPAATGFGSTSTFGQPQQQQSTNLFGNTQAQQPSGFGAFGSSNNAAPKPLFGQQPSNNAFGGGTGLFGNQQNTQGQQPNQQQPTGGLFGNTNPGGLFGQNSQQQTQPNQPNNLFGSNQTQQQSQTGGLFGPQPSGGLFGSTGGQQQSQPQQSTLGGSLFGKPNTGSNLFGGSTNTTVPNPNNPLFGGNSLGQPSNPQSTASLFGKPGTAQPTGQPQNAFGSSSQFGGNPLGSSNTFSAAPGAQGTLTASIDQPIGANLPIFSLLPPGPHAVTLDGYGSKKKVDFFVDVPTRSPVPFPPRGSTPANSKLRGGGPRGFASSSYLGSSTNGSGSTISFNSGKINALSLSKAPNGRNALGSDSFSGTSLGSGGRESVKKLVVDKKVDLFELSGRTPSPANVTFNPALSVAAREKEAANGPLGVSRSTASPSFPQKSPPTSRPPNRFTAQITGELLTDKSDKQLKEGDYWSKPDMSELALWGYNELVSIKDLVVGRVGYGQIAFLEPVDLTNSGSVRQLFGDLVRFEDKECSVYPELDDVDKPSPGSGLNVRARIELVGCWALDKSSREPIKDEKHPLAIKHFKRLKNMKDTKFEGFDLEEGKWTFSVDHF